MTNPNVIEMADRIQSIIKSDEAVLAFCMEKYHCRPWFFKGILKENPPSADYYPLVALYSFFQSGGGTNKGNIVYEIDIAAGVANANIDIDFENKTISLPGILESEALRSAVFSALAKGALGKITLKDGVVGIEDAAPFFRSNMTVQIEVQNLQRRT